jgi:hypothetical protein
MNFSQPKPWRRLERETGIEPATSSLGKRVKIVYQGLWRFLKAILFTVLPEFPRFDRECRTSPHWLHQQRASN